MSTLFEKMTAIADNIRSLLGLTEKLGLDAMNENLETANTEVESQKNIIEQLRSVISEKAGKPLGGSIDDLIDGSITEITSNVKLVYHYGFYMCTNLKSVTLPVATSVGSNSFQYCNNLETIYAPNLYSIGNSAFRECKKLINITLQNVNNIGNEGFYNCKGLTTIYCPKLETISENAFRYCSNISLIDLSMLKNIESRAFNACQLLKTFVLRSETICTLAAIDALGNTPIASGTGYIYVPRALVDSYKTATNWTTYASQFRALEDYTVDGTTAGELDESKI